MEYTSKEVYEYISKKTNDPIVERKKCRVSGQDFAIYQSDIDFYSKMNLVFEVDEGFVNEFLEKNTDIKKYFEYKDGKLEIKMPTPTLCPEERERRRFSFMNEQCLYKRDCDHSGKLLIGIFSPDKPYIVYDQDFWRTFNRDPYKIRDNKNNFDDNISDILLRTPIANRAVLNCENSDYTNQVREARNSYMCFNCIEIEDCLYVYKGVSYNKNCVDCDNVDHCSLCYESINLKNCMSLFYCQNCSDCSNSWYLINCIGCHDCFNCNNIENKSYCINNKQYKKEEYNEKISDLKKENHGTITYLGFTQKDCDLSFGDNLVGCKNTIFSSELTNCENVKYSCDVMGMKNCYDTRGINAQFCLESYLAGEDYHCGFLFESRSNVNSRYCIYCHNSQNLFGCVGLKNKEYCVYNKQYTKEEYNKLVPEIIAQMIRNKQRGEFFNPKLAFYGYNETMAMEEYPLEKEQAIKMGYKWSDYESPTPKVEKFVPGENLPKVGCKTIQEKKPDFLKKILNYAIVCEVSKKPFRLVQQEIDFYVKYNLPLPTKHPEVRHKERFLKKDSGTIFLVNCDSCGENMLSVHKPGPGKSVLCEKCYYKNK